MLTTWIVLFKLKVDDPLDATAGKCLIFINFFLKSFICKQIQIVNRLRNFKGVFYA